MATIKVLKGALEQKASEISSSPREPLSEAAEKAGFDILMQDPAEITYREFIVHQLSQTLEPLIESRVNVSVLEIVPGRKSVLGYLPVNLRQRIKRYSAIEPYELFATTLKDWLGSIPSAEPPFPCLASPATVRQDPFDPNVDMQTGDDEGFDLALFCDRLYDMNPKRKFVEWLLEELSESGVILLFHQSESLSFDGLVCCKTASFPSGAVRVADRNEVLDSFAPFVADFVFQDVDADHAIRPKWRDVCRALGRRDESYPGHLRFSSPVNMVAFTKHATALSELTTGMPLWQRGSMIKNRDSRLHHPAAIVRPTSIPLFQKCIRWAVKHGVGLSVIGGSHSGHCVWPNVVAVDMEGFNAVHIYPNWGASEPGLYRGPVVVAEAGCKTGDIIRKAMASGLTVPLGSCPSVGAGLWLQGGIGHLSRLHGLACDAIIGAILISADSGRLFCIGCVPNQHRPAGAVRPDNEADLLWAIKGAGTNLGIVFSVTFKAYPAPTLRTQSWLAPLNGKSDANAKFTHFEEFTGNLPRQASADAYLYYDDGQLHLGVTTFESSSSNTPAPTITPKPVGTWIAVGKDVKLFDRSSVFETGFYMNYDTPGGHGDGKTSSFKRCVFIKGIGASDIVDRFLAAFENAPTPSCYLHLMHGGGAISDVAAKSTAFGCRDWDFACVITGIWPRDKDGTEIARDTTQWVYDVALDLLPVSRGAYSADLGPDPRDSALASVAFGPNGPRLARLKAQFDPCGILTYASPLPRTLMEPRLIILLSGESGAGKDHCAGIWMEVLTHQGLAVRAISISETTKREYAAATGASLEWLLQDRAYKEEHRPALEAFFLDQVRHRPRLAEKHFLDAVYDAAGVDVLLITGIRDEAPVTIWSHLVPGSRLFDVRVEASEETRRARRGCYDDDSHRRSYPTTHDYHPSLVLDNDVTGDEAVRRFAEQKLLPLVHEDLRRLASMIRTVPDFPRPGIQFRHVLNISQQPNGLALCASLLENHFTREWEQVSTLACCEAGGFIFASALSARINIPLALIRNAGKLPPPLVSTHKISSHISSGHGDKKQTIEIDRELIPSNGSVVVVDDVLATGRTLCAVLQLLTTAGVCVENIRVMVVAEFPFHRGRALLREYGFGAVEIQSLLILDGA